MSGIHVDVRKIATSLDKNYPAVAPNIGQLMILTFRTITSNMIPELVFNHLENVRSDRGLSTSAPETASEGRDGTAPLVITRWT